MMLEKIQARQELLYNRQPHEDEWDSSEDELEYFVLDTLSALMYPEELDVLVSYPLDKDEVNEVLLSVVRKLNQWDYDEKTAEVE